MNVVSEPFLENANNNILRNFLIFFRVFFNPIKTKKKKIEYNETNIISLHFPVY